MNNIQALLCDHICLCCWLHLGTCHLLCFNKQSLALPSLSPQQSNWLHTMGPLGLIPPPNQGLPSSSLWRFPCSGWAHHHLPSQSHPTFLLCASPQQGLALTLNLSHTGLWISWRQGSSRCRKEVTCQGPRPACLHLWTLRAILCSSGCWAAFLASTRY